MFYCGFNRFLHRVPNLVVGETESRASTTPTTTTFHQRMSAINPRREFVGGKATETGGETPLRARERKGWAAETPNSHQHLERGVHMDRTRKCFGADIPNLVAVKTENRANTTPHHHRNPSKIFSIKNRQGAKRGETPLRIRERKGWAAETPNSPQRLERGGHMGRTRECFGADIPNLVAVKTASRTSTRNIRNIEENPTLLN